MSRIKRIHIPIACTAGAFVKRDIPLYGNLVGIAKRPFPFDAVQTVTVLVDGSGGTFDIVRNSVTVGSIPANSTAAAVQALLVASATFVGTTVTRSGSADAYTYTLTFGGAAIFDTAGLQIGGTGSHYTVTAPDSLTGGAGTTTVTNTSALPMTSTADINLRDQLSNALIYGDLSFGAGTYEVPTMPITDNVGAAIAAAAGHSIDAPIPLSGMYSLYIANATTTDVGSLWLLVQE